MKISRVLSGAFALALCASQSALATTIGFSQVGSESGWRTSFSESVKAEAEKRGIELKFSDAQQKQENQIKAVRSFIAQGVDAIMIAPVVETGWKPVLREAKRARIPVVILDRNVDVKNQSLFLTRIASDFVEEGRRAAQWLMDETEGNCKILELQGTVGATAAIDRMKGFNEVIAKYPNSEIVRSQTGEFTRTKGKEVMEAMLKAENSGKGICALWSHNDEMALGAIQAIKEAGLKPGEDMLVVSVDGVPDYFKAMADGDANATVELNPHLGAPAFDVIEAYLKGDRKVEKLITTTGDLFTQETAAEEYAKRAGN
ncbi:ABC transporter substrate-binding protein [Microbulbifer hydrolyticus]|uniref:Simple sugar transport system substrate-binding protein n=1 Tax=Microbulbifer hydrolyticus TaxID=48074 RepID=A0A6P1T7Y2_9GAMM|nr:ABC transporter substrate-binding protein [Microbulbifer hydrolyticus]MBB5211072.1 simple sugar transport system substrate-binding protein [Microbulbifer hydrolyticus]QHQ38137.1 substrate-binding domain-containing protein [Microbulbifer hydrolyticus]